jgi:hypothetical protein
MRIPKAPAERIDWLYSTLARLRRSMDDRRAKALAERRLNAADAQHRALPLARPSFPTRRSHALLHAGGGL